MIFQTAINYRSVCIYLFTILSSLQASVLHCGSLILPMGFSSVDV